ncbi:MAG: hypothetical protein M1837_004682 [Sclerophora amabilis]|nr:MAG: hypothetical protein M1837_004682 [Sclerophora amabilis]
MAHGGDPEQPLGSGSPSQAQRVREHRLDSQSSPETLDPCDSSPARSADDAEEVGSSKPAWLRFNAPSEIEIIPDGTPAEITSVITRSLQNFRAEKIAEEAKANVSVLTRSDDQSPCAIIKDDMEVSNGPQTTPSISREGGSQVDQSSRRHHHSSNTSATSSSSVSAAQTHSAETSSSSVSSRLPAAHSSTNVIDSKPVSRRRRQPVSAMGPLGLTTFYAPLPINSRPSAVHQKSPRAEALRKYFKGKKEFR